MRSENYQATPAQKTQGIGFLGLLALAFIVLKLTDVIAWSWWWVLSPLWAIPAALLLLAALLFVAFWIRRLIRRWGK